MRWPLAQIKKRISFFRVVSIQGARQTGKSYLAREILPKQLQNMSYVTFDSKAERSRAEKSPDSFLTRYDSSRTLAIDEAQKVPSIFDAVKL